MNIRWSTIATGGLWMACALAAPAALAQVQTFRLAPLADATIFSDGSSLPSVWDTTADGAGDSLWTSVTAGGIVRRALMRFDLSAIPAGQQVVSVSLTLYESRARDLHDLHLHRLLADWSEGPADGGAQGVGAPAQAGDVTWAWRSFDGASGGTAWNTRGGDYVGTASASQAVGSPNQAYTWTSTPLLVADVQGWLDRPAENFGWILLGNELAQQNAKRFDSVESAVAQNRPLLQVQVAPIPEPGTVALWLAGMAWLARRAMVQQARGVVGA